MGVTDVPLTERALKGPPPTIPGIAGFFAPLSDDDAERPDANGEMGVLGTFGLFVLCVLALSAVKSIVETLDSVRRVGTASFSGDDLSTTGWSVGLSK